MISLLHQTKDITIFIRDDGSNDGTLGIIKQYTLEHSNIISVQDTKSSSSPQENFSYLLEYVCALNKFHYFMFCDQDDVWYENKVEKTLATFESLENKFPQKPLLVHTDLKVADSKFATIGESFWQYNSLDPNQNELRHLLLQNTVTGCTVMINKKLAEVSLPFPKEMLHDWWLAIVASAVGNIKILPEQTMLYRLHGSNSAGIEKYNFNYIYKKFMSVFKQSTANYFLKYIVQAELLFKRVSPMLKEEEKVMLFSFIKLKSSGRIKKIKTIFKYRLFKQGFLRTLGMLLQITLKKNNK